MEMEQEVRFASEWAALIYQIYANYRHAVMCTKYISIFSSGA